MIESQQDRELALRQLAEAFDEGFAACFRRFVSTIDAPRLKTGENPYRMKEEK